MDARTVLEMHRQRRERIQGIKAATVAVEPTKCGMRIQTRGQPDGITVSRRPMPSMTRVEVDGRDMAECVVS